MKVLVACVLLACFDLSIATKFKDCGSTGANVTKVDISGCDDSAKNCMLQQNKEMNGCITFTPNKPSDTIKAKLYIKVFTKKIDINLEEPDVCKVEKCPLAANKEVTYCTKFTNTYYTAFGVSAYWKLQDASEKDIVCVRVPAGITKAPTQAPKSGE